MTSGRVVLIAGGAALLGAWLASAGSILWSDRDQPPAAAGDPAPTTGADTLADDVRKQAERLRLRLDAAPAPSAPVRNPFAFGRAERRSPPPLPALVEALLAPDPPAPPPPRLRLIGVAEEATPGGVVRTAVISGDDQLFLVKAGDKVTDRFTVKAVGADGVELTDAGTGAALILVLR
jgi:hypothetical protein